MGRAHHRRLFAPDIDMEEIGPRRVPPAHHAFRGEVTRMLLQALRNATRPLTTTEPAERVMQERGLDMNNVQLKRTMGRRVGASLNHWKRVRGLVTSMPGPGQVNMWEIKR